MDSKEKPSFRLEDVKAEGTPDTGVVKILGGNTPEVKPEEKSAVKPAPTPSYMSCEYKEDVRVFKDYGEQ